MVEKEEVLKEKLEHSGIFNFSELYTYMHSWFVDNLFGVNEGKYIEKLTGNAKDINFEWKATKKVSDYFKFEYKMKVNVTGLIDVEVEIDGEKKKMNKGKIAMEIKGIILKDYKNTWEETKPIYKFFREAYDKFVIPRRIEKMELKVEEDVRSFKDEVKAFLELSGKR